MNPSELTFEVVRDELKALIQRYPDRKGSVVVQYQGSDIRKCVYYTDEHGNMITVDTYRDDDEGVQFVTPVCIIGQWIEDFHPEYKQDPKIRRVLLRNGTFGSTFDYELPFDDDVHDLLSDVQSRQDSYGKTWKDIEL